MADMKDMLEMEDYLFERMGVEERERYEVRLAGNAGLRAELEELREELKLAKAATAAREYERFREVSENAMRRRRMRRRNVVFGVGAMAVAAGIALLLLLRPSAYFVDTYFSPADPASVLGVEPADPVNVGMGHYEKGEYASAASEFGKVEENDPDYDLARFYRANCLVAMGDLEGYIGVMHRQLAKGHLVRYSPLLLQILLLPLLHWQHIPKRI